MKVVQAALSLPTINNIDIVLIIYKCIFSVPYITIIAINIILSFFVDVPAKEYSIHICSWCPVHKSGFATFAKATDL